MTLQGRYLAYDSKQLDFAPGLFIPIQIVNGDPLIAATVDLLTRYALSDGLFLRFGQGAIPIGLSPAFSLAIAANGGIGYQITSKAVIFADLNVLTLLLAPDAAITGLWETLSLSAGGQYTPTRQWDVGGVLTLNNTWSVQRSFAFTFTVYGRYRF